MKIEPSLQVERRRANKSAQIGFGGDRQAPNHRVAVLRGTGKSA